MRIARVAYSSLVIIGLLFIVGCSSLRNTEYPPPKGIKLGKLPEYKGQARPVPLYSYAIQLSQVYWNSTIEDFYIRHNMQTVWIHAKGLKSRGES